MRHLLPILLALLALASCKPELPPDVISEHRMENILHDYHMAQGLAENTPREDGVTGEMLLHEYHNAVFRKYDITQEQFDRSMSFYCSDMTRLVRIYEHVTKRLEREAELYGIQAANLNRDAYAELSEEGDTANVWHERMVIAMKPRPLENFFSWRIETDSTWLEGDDLFWRAQVTQLSRSAGIMHVDLVVTYTTDSVRSAITHYTSSRFVEVRITSPVGWMPREVAGHAYLPINDDSEDYRLMLIHNPILVRIHKPESVRMQAQPDSLAADSIAIADSLRADSVATDSLAGRRLSPTEFREQQDVERTIHVIKEQQFDPRSRQRGYQQRRRRRN